MTCTTLRCTVGRRALVTMRTIAICYLTTISIPHRHNTDMGIRDSVSKPFKKLKNRFVEGIRKRRDGSRSDSNRGGGGTDAEDSEADQSSHLYPETEDVAKSGPNREENDDKGKTIAQVNPPTPMASISRIDSGKPLPSIPSLIVSSTNTGTCAVPNLTQEAPHPNKSEPNIADEKKSGWKSTASATAKLFLRGVRDSADAFGPLKSVAGGLCFILENCEVCSSSHVYHRRYLQVLQRTKGNEQAIESLAPRVKALSGSLCTPVPEDDLKEQERRKKLER